jgi:hypothetical protein
MRVMPIRMRFRMLAAAGFLLFPLTACGGRAINKKTAQNLIVQSPLSLLSKEEVYIESVTQTGQRDAVVEASLHAAFRFEKVEGKWVIREVRLGKRPWESLDNILRALDLVKSDETRKLLDQVAAAVARYREKKGALPEFKDYVALSDALSPDFLTPLIRQDAWQNPLAAFRIGPNSIRLLSAGPDGKPGTADDIELTRTFAP